MIVHSVCYSLLVILVVALLFLLTLAIIKNKDYEDFFEHVINKVGHSSGRLRELLDRRDEFTVDDDVVLLYGIVQGLYDFLIGYDKNAEKEEGKERE